MDTDKDGFSPIGNNENPYSGIFDGNNFTIDSLFINYPQSDNIGFFGIIQKQLIINS